MSPARRPRTRLSPERRRREILAAATDAFRTQEYSAVSLDDIADAAGVTRGLLHHYFGSKRDLYLRVVERSVRIPDSVGLVPAGAAGDLADVVSACVNAWLVLIEGAGGLWSASGGTGEFADGDVDAILTAARDRLVERMVAELPFPDGIDLDLLRSVVRCYGALARVASNEWLVAKTLTRDQTAALLSTALVNLVERSLPAMDPSRRSQVSVRRPRAAGA